MNDSQIQEEIDKSKKEYEDESTKEGKNIDNYPLTAFVLFKGISDKKRVQEAFSDTQFYANINWMVSTPLNPLTKAIEWKDMVVEDGMEP
jgi:hypothetical protein